MNRSNKLGQVMYELSNKFEDLHLKMRTHKRLKIPFSNQRKSLRSKPDFKNGDVVFYYFSPRGVLNLSRKPKLSWTGHRIVNLPSEALSIIYPLRTWTVNGR